MNINGITTIVSSSCNLKCSFCYLHKHNALINFDKEILEAWNNQSYPKIVDRVINKMGENSYNIQNWTLWGGESLIHIDSITKNVKEIFSLFPNINNIILSTNWTININQFFEFLKEIDCYATKDVDIQLQLSIDGPEGLLSEQGHNGWKYYKENIKLFTNLMNNHKFKNITVHLYLNATVAKETYIEVFQKKENIIDYVSKMYDFINYMKSLTVSRYLEIDCNYIFPGCANPHDATTQEGIKIGASITKNHVKTGRFPYLKTTYYGLFGQGTESYLEIIDLALKKGVINKSGAFYKIIDDSGEPVILEDGTKLQWQGTARLRNYLIENPEFYSKLVTQLGGNTDIESMSEKEIEIAKEQEEKEKETHVKSLTSNKKSSKKKKKEEEENKIVQEEENTNA